MKKDELKLLEKNLPLIPGFNGKEEYLNSVVLALLTPQDKEYHLVFEKRCRGITQGGEICLPGGKYEEEKDATLEMAVLRETNEELGIPQEEIKILGRLDTVIATMGAAVDVFVGITGLGLQNMKVNPDEVEKAFTLPVSYFQTKEPEEYQVMIKAHPFYVDKNTGEEVILLPAAELGLPERYRKPWGGFRHKVLVYKTEEGLIWGITARIVHDLVSRIG